MQKVGALIFPGFELLDLFGPLEMFGLLPDRFDLRLVAETSDPVPSNQQVSAQPDATLARGDPFDILLIPGGAGTRREVSNPAVLAWIRAASERADHVLGVCTGSLLLAGAGVLDGRRATTNKMAFEKIATQWPKVDWIREARWVEDGKFVTASGVSAGMDMALGVIAMIHGRDTAEQVAIWSEYHWNSDKTQDPFARIHGLV